MYRGTMSMRSRGPKRCSAPKTHSGTAKHRLLAARILSRPLAWVISLFAAHNPITKSAMPAEQVATTIPEMSKNVARMVAGIWHRRIALAQSEDPFLGPAYRANQSLACPRRQEDQLSL